MYKCNICGFEFEEDFEPQYTINEFGLKTEYCPKCKDENCLEKFHECERCQENMIPEDEIFCNKCKRNIQETFKTLLRNNFNKEEIKYIDVMIEGEYLFDYLGYEEDKK